MKTTTDYKILTDAVLADLETAVKVEIALGWQTAGGALYDGSDYFQTLVKEIDTPVTNYTVIHRNSLVELEAEVLFMLAAGWTLYGSKQGTGAGGYEQAFIKY